MLRHIVLPILILIVGVSADSVLAQTSSQKVSHATVGELETVSKDGKSITVKTADGTEQVFKVTGKTAVSGNVAGAKGVGLAGKEGSQVVVKYSEDGTEKTAAAVKVAAKDTFNATEGTVTKVDKSTRKVTVKMADGTEKTFVMTKNAMVDSGNGVYDGTKFSAKTGEKVVVYSTVNPTKSVVHLFKKL